MKNSAFLIEQFTDEKETWKPEYNAAMERRDFEDRLRTGIGFYFVIRSGDEAWSKKVQAGTIKFDAKRVREFHAAYTWWIAPCESMLKQLKLFDKNYKEPVKNGELFRNCYEEAKRIVSIDMDEFVESAMQTEHGKTSPRAQGDRGGKD